MGFKIISTSSPVRRKILIKTRSLDPQHLKSPGGSDHHNHPQLQCLIITTFIFFIISTTTSAASHFATSHLSQTLSASASSASSSSRVVTTKYGSLRGNLVRLSTSKTSSSSTSDQHSSPLPSVEAFLGVPYATPPTGGLRFMPPVTPSHWRGIRLATAPSAVCPQTIPVEVLAAVRAPDAATAHRKVTRARHETLRRLVPLLGNQSEDCLYLNVYVPVLSGSQQGTRSWSSSASSSSSESSWSSQTFQTPSSSLPVIVLLPGESFSWGAGSLYDGSLLAAYGQVVVVTLNARLGVLGFLPSFSDGSLRGNYGLMDTVAALHWVVENIAEFGGQPANVTLLGTGWTGAAMAHLIALSPMAKGLFSRVALLGGSALSPQALVRDPETYARALGAQLNCTTLESMTDCLRSVPVSVLMSAGAQISPPEHLTAFGPILDGVVVPMDPRPLHQSALLNQMISTSSSSSSSSSSSLNGHNHHNPLNLLPLPPRSFDLLVGATTADGPCLFNEEELTKGLETGRRDRLLRSLVRNLFDVHQQSIYLMVRGEYAGWNSGDKKNQDYHHRSEESLRSAISFLSEGISLVPLLQAAELAEAQPVSISTSSSGPPRQLRTFAFVFDVNSASSTSSSFELPSFSSSSMPSSSSSTSFNPKLVTCSSSSHHQLAYLLGDPLGQQLFNWQGESQLGPFFYDQQQQQMQSWTEAAQHSELMMQYMVNFARFGDPNIRSAHFRPPPPLLSPSSSRYQPPTSYKSTSTNSFLPPFWPVYTSSSTAYLSFRIGSGDSTQPPPSTAFFSSQHRLGLWLQLIPRLILFGDDNGAEEGSSSSEDSSVNFKRINKTSNSSSYHTLQYQLPILSNQSYEGVVRSAQMIAAGQNRSRSLWQYSASKNSVITSSKKVISGGGNPSSNLTHVHLSEEEAIVQASEPASEQQQPLPPQPSPTSSSSSSSSSSSNSFGQLRSPNSNSIDSTSYSQPLFIAVTIGCALLLLNVVVCSALYRQCRLNRRLITEASTTSTTTFTTSNTDGDKTKNKTSNSVVNKQQQSNCNSTLTKSDHKARSTLNNRSPQMVHHQIPGEQIGPSVSLLSTGSNHTGGGTLSRRSNNHHNFHNPQHLSQLSTPSIFPLETLKTSASSPGESHPQPPPQLLMLNSTTSNSTELNWTTNSSANSAFLSSGGNHQNHHNPNQQQQQTYFCLVPDTGPTNTFI